MVLSSYYGFCINLIIWYNHGNCYTYYCRDKWGINVVFNNLKQIFCAFVFDLEFKMKLVLMQTEN